MTSRLSLPQLPGSEPQPLTSGPASPCSTVSPTPKIHTQLSLKSSPVRPEPAQPTTPPQQGAARKSGRVPFNWNVVAPGSSRASLCQPSSQLDVPSTYTVGPRTPAAAAENMAADLASSAEVPWAAISHQAAHAGGRKSIANGQVPATAGASPGGKALGNSRSFGVQPEGTGPSSSGVPHLLGEHLEGAKMLGRGPSPQDNPQAPMNWFDGYALTRMQQLWAEHLAASEALGQQANAAMRRQHREMLKVVVTLQPGDLRGLNDRVSQFIQEITECEATHARACQIAESRWADSIHTIVMVAFVRGLEAALAERESYHQQLLREWERGRQKDVEDMRALAALEQKKALRQLEVNLAKQWTLDEEKRQGNVKAAREAAVAELQQARVQLAAGKHEVTSLKRHVDMLEAQVRAMKAVQQANTRLHQELDALTEQLNTLRYLHAQCGTGSSRGSSPPQLPSSTGLRQPAWGSNPVQRSLSGQATLQRSNSRLSRPRSPPADPSGSASSLAALWSPNEEPYAEYLGTEQLADESSAATKVPAKKRKKRGKSKGPSKKASKKAAAESGDESRPPSMGATGKAERGAGKLRKLVSEPPTPSLGTPRSARIRPASTGSPMFKGPKALDPLLESASEAEEDDSAAEEESIMGSTSQSQGTTSHSRSISDAAFAPQDGHVSFEARSTGSPHPAAFARAAQEGHQDSAAGTISPIVLRNGNGRGQLNSEQASPRGKARAAKEPATDLNSQPASPRLPPSSTSSGANYQPGAGNMRDLGMTDDTTKPLPSDTQRETSAAANRADAVPTFADAHADIQVDNSSETLHGSDQLQQPRQQAIRSPANGSIPAPAVVITPGAIPASVAISMGSLSPPRQKPQALRSPRAAPPTQSPRGIPPQLGFLMETDSSIDQPLESFRAAFTPEVPNFSATLQGSNTLSQPIQQDSAAASGAMDEVQVGVTERAAANKSRIMEAMWEHRALAAKDGEALGVVGAHVGVLKGGSGASAAAADRVGGGRLRVGAAAGPPPATQSALAGSGYPSRAHRNAIEVLGTHLAVQEAPVPDRTAYSLFVRSLSPPRLQPITVRPAEPAASDRPTSSPASGNPPPEQQDPAGLQVEKGEVDPLRPTSSPEPTRAKTPQEDPAADAAAVEVEEPASMAAGAEISAQVPQAVAPLEHRVRKQVGQQLFKEGAKQIPPPFPGHKLGQKHPAASLPAGVTAEQGVGAEAQAAANGETPKQLQPMTAEAAAAAMFVGQRPKERGQPAVAARSHKQLWPPSVIGQQQRKILRLTHPGTAAHLHQQNQTWHFTSTAAFTPRPQHIPTLEELSVAVANPTALEPSDSQETRPGAARNTTHAPYTLQPPSLATANMHRQLLGYMDMLLQQHRAHQQMHGH
ncbi:hypothetical protein WJX74_000247 [Apatococcus lobatus]|uniref:Uncharacterized protein n=1 Tax=Apatococcus lobatus TaxID=904363 RepID=A0AAW1S1S1_9CHLO